MPACCSHAGCFFCTAFFLPSSVALGVWAWGLRHEHRCRQPPEVPLTPAQDSGKFAHVHVAYSTDLANKSSSGLLASMVSLARHLADPAQCTIHVILPQACMEQMQALLPCFRQELASLPAVPAVSLHKMIPPRVEVSELDPRTRDGRPFRHWLIRPETFVRIFLEDYLPTAPRVLWLDHDTVIKSDVAPLYRMHMKSPVAAAVEWCSHPMDPLPTAVFKPFCPLYFYLKQGKTWADMEKEGFLDRDPHLSIFNTGVMLIDLERWRYGDIAESIAQLVRISQGFEGDQAAVNLFFNGTNGIDVLDWRWNLQHHLYHVFNLMPWPDACVSEARILHFSGESKPWAHCKHTGSQDPTCLSPFFWRTTEVFKRHGTSGKCGTVG